MSHQRAPASRSGKRSSTPMRRKDMRATEVFGCLWPSSQHVEVLLLDVLRARQHLPHVIGCAAVSARKESAAPVARWTTRLADKSASVIAVRTRPGMIVKTATPRPQVSAASFSVSLRSAAKHAGQDRPRTIERPAQIDLHRLPPLVTVRSRYCCDRAELTRIVDQDIDQAECALHARRR
jgi:hypothetical protein